MNYNIEKLLELANTDTDVDEECKKLTAELLCTKSGVSTLVENLQNVLINEEVSIRRGGIEILSTILQQLPSTYMNSDEIQHLIGYFGSYLVDHHSFIPPIIRAFLALVKMDNLPDNCASKIFTIFNLNFTFQSQSQADRFVCYQLLNIMMLRKTKELQDLGPDFVCGYLSAVDSERDPRNLMYLFENFPRFFQKFPPGHLIEDAFEAVACYFPVDFRSNPDDPRGINREDLSGALMPCLTAVPEFCNNAVELALDKLQSNLKVAKIDSLLLLKRGFQNFPPDLLCPLISQIMSTLNEQLKPSFMEEDVENLAVETTSELLKYLSLHNRNKEMQETLEALLVGFKHFTNDINNSFFPVSIKFLGKIISCKVACEFIVDEVLTKILQFELTNVRAVLVALEAFTLLLPYCVRFHINCSELSRLKDMWNKVPQLFLTHCSNSNTTIRFSAIVGIPLVIQLFELDDRQKLYSSLVEQIKYERNDNIRIKCIYCIRDIAFVFPEEVRNILDTSFNHHIDDPAFNNDIKKRIIQCRCILSPVSGFLPLLHSTFEIYVIKDNSGFATFVLQELSNLIVTESKMSEDFLVALHREVKIIHSLIDWWYKICNAHTGDIGPNTCNNENTAENVYLILCNIVKVLNDQSQKAIFEYYWKLTEDNMHDFMNSFKKLNSNCDNNENMTTLLDCSLEIALLKGIVIGLSAATIDNLSNVPSILNHLLEYLKTVAIYCSRPFCRKVACHIIASIINKLSNKNSFVDEQAECLFVFICDVIDKNKIILTENAVDLLIYITKALLLRGYNNLHIWLDKLLILISHEELTNKVAQGFKVMTTEDEYNLNGDFYHEIKLFYRQRLFSYMIPKFVTVCNNPKNMCSTIVRSCAISTVYTMNHLPTSVVIKYIKQILPILCVVLNEECHQEDSLTVLEKIQCLLVDNKAMFEEYSSVFLPKLLNLAKQSQYMKVRIASLKCLYEYAKSDPLKLLSLKNNVVHELASCIDDHKRLVRKEAVKTRTRWITLGI